MLHTCVTRPAFQYETEVVTCRHQLIRFHNPKFLQCDGPSPGISSGGFTDITQFKTLRRL